MEAFWSFACVLGLRLRALARFPRLESEEGSSSSDIGAGDAARLVADRVMGAK